MTGSSDGDIIVNRNKCPLGSISFNHNYSSHGLKIWIELLDNKYSTTENRKLVN